jgi:hypothetical protein
VDASLTTGPGAPPTEWLAAKLDQAATSPRYAGARAWARQHAGVPITGLTGRLVWARYGVDPASPAAYHAADVHGWSMRFERGRARWVIEAIVAKVDAFNVRQQPLFFIAPIKDQKGQPAVWRWQVLPGFATRGPMIVGDAVYVRPRSRS